MAKDASQALGAAEVAGTVVSRRGPTGAPGVPSFGRMGYLSVSETTVAVTRTSQLGWTPRPAGDALVRVPRSEVASITLEQARLLSHLKLRFTNGVTWEFDVPRVHRTSAKALVTELGGSIS